MHFASSRGITAGIVLALAAATAYPLKAQVTVASVHGTVSDVTGAVIPNATVTVENTSTGITTTAHSDKSGYFVFPQLQVGGPYTLTVVAPGFNNFSTNGLNLNVNDNRDVDAKLAVGSAGQTVEVSATAVQVETSNTQLQQVITAEQLEQVPLEGRDPAGLQKLAAGTVESSDRFGSYASNGSQSAQNSYIVSGTDINDVALNSEGLQVNPDALQEENIAGSTLNPEFARNSGAVVNQVLKSGTNQWHGSGFEFYRDTFLNLGNYFSATRPVFHQNLYGGTFGGALVKNRLFFFLGYQGLRSRTASTNLANTLSLANATGDFTADSNLGTGDDNTAGLTTNALPFNVGTCIADPTSPNALTWQQCYASGGFGANGSINIPTSQWNAVQSKIIQNFVPAANYGTAQYNFNATDTTAQDQGIVRLDYTPTSRDSLWASTIFQSSPAINALSFGGSSFPGSGEIQADHIKVFSVSYTHTFTPNLLNELRGGYYRNNFPSVIPQTITPPSSYGFSINPELDQAGLPYQSVGPYFSLGNSYEGPQPRTDTNLTIADNFTWVKGNHNLKFGGLWEQFRVHNPFGYLNNGYYYYDGEGNFSSGDPLIDFVLGIPDGYEQTSDGFIDAVGSERYAYAQDNWKATSDLTINYGLAWDSEQPFQDRQYNGLGVVCYRLSNQQSNIFPGGPPGLLYPGDPGCNSAGGVATRYDHFGPRVGFAWSPSSGPSFLFGSTGAHSFSVRGGFGVYFNRDQEEQSLQNLTDPPFLYTSYGAGDIGLSPALANPFADVAGRGSKPNPFPYAVPAVGTPLDTSLYNQLGLSAFDAAYNTPYNYNFNLNVQRALPFSMVATVSYVGSLGRRLATWYEGDPITAAGHDACAAGATLPGAAAVLGSCNGPALRSNIHRYFPQFTAQPAVVPNSASDFQPNGVPYYLGVGDQNSEGSSNYNSLQASLIKTSTHGLYFSAAYTYAHALDNASGYESATGGGGPNSAGRPLNYVPGYAYLNYGDSDYDARQRFVTSYVYSIPVTGFLKKNLISRELLAGWGLGGVTAFQNGFPIALTQGSDRSLWCDSGSFFGCPDNPNTSSFKIGTFNPRSNSSTHQYFDTTPFSNEAVGTFGNTKRNFFHGPGYNYTNLQLSKTIPFSADGKRSIQLRLEAFNAFNHANFSNPSGNLSSPVFGQVTSVLQSADPNQDPQPGRAVQLAGKFYF